MSETILRNTGANVSSDLPQRRLTLSQFALRWLAAVAASEEGAAGGSVGLVRWGVAVVVALGGATPECPRVGIRYWRCPSPTSTWGAATSRLAAVAITLIPSVCPRRIVPVTSRIPLCRPSPSPPPLPLTLAADNERKRERTAPYKARNYHHYHPNPPRNRPLHQPSSRTTTNYHAPPSRVILVKVNESKVSTEHFL